MSESFTGEIRAFAGGRLPSSGWLLCNGQLVSVSQYGALFEVLGRTYGGDGYRFALPNLMGRMPMQSGQGAGLSARALGDSGGSEKVNLTQNQMPKHTHQAQAYNQVGDTTSPENAVWARARVGKGFTNMYCSKPSLAPMHPATTEKAGGGQPHNNMPPYLTVTFGISFLGIFPH